MLIIISICTTHMEGEEALETHHDNTILRTQNIDR